MRRKRTPRPTVRPTVWLDDPHNYDVMQSIAREMGSELTKQFLAFEEIRRRGARSELHFGFLGKRVLAPYQQGDVAAAENLRPAVFTFRKVFQPGETHHFRFQPAVAAKFETVMWNSGENFTLLKAMVNNENLDLGGLEDGLPLCAQALQHFCPITLTCTAALTLVVRWDPSFLTRG